MKAYDFDGTIYNGDSSVDFLKFCIKEDKRLILHLFKFFWGIVLHIVKAIDLIQLKERYFSFLTKVKNIDNTVEKFWNSYEKKIYNWYLEQKNDDDVIISASPEFLLKPICNKLNVTLIASQVNKNTGKFTGNNCKGEEKVIRFKNDFPDIEPEEFYSDSFTDTPMKEISQKSYITKKGKIYNWESYKPSFIEKCINTYLTKDFIYFVFCGGVGTIVNFCFSLLFSTRIDPTLSYILGYTISLFATYYLNSTLIFKEKLSLDKYLKFVLSYVPNFVILFTFVAVLLNIFGINKILVYLLAALFGLPITFLIVKVFAFKKVNES